MEEEIKKIGNRIKEIRKAKGMTQKQLAEALDISFTNMSNIETGKTAVTIQNLIKMKAIFGCELKDFFTEKMPMSSNSQAEKDNKYDQLTARIEENQEKTEEKPPESIDLQDAINLLRLLRRIDIKGL